MPRTEKQNQSPAAGNDIPEGAYNTIEEAIEELRAGRIILVTDDPDRENEGDFICAAQFATTENVNFMASQGKGLICMPTSRPPPGVPPRSGP